MAKWSPVISFLTDASGAAKAGKQGDLTVIVDVISMSTTAEAVLEVGAKAVYGAASKCSRSPSGLVCPEQMGFIAATRAKELDCGVILIAEPRVGDEAERKENALPALWGMEKVQVEPEMILPNIGAEIIKLCDFRNKVILFVTDSGGVAFDAAFFAGAPHVLTATVARTLNGSSGIREKVRNILQQARILKTDIAVIAASSNAVEDVLGAEHLVEILLEERRKAISVQ